MKKKISLCFGSKVFTDRSVRVNTYIYDPISRKELPILKVIKDVPDSWKSKLEVVGHTATNARIGISAEFGGIWNTVNIEAKTPLIIKTEIKNSRKVDNYHVFLLAAVHENANVSNLVIKKVPDYSNGVFSDSNKSLMSGYFDDVEFEIAVAEYGYVTPPIYRKVFNRPRLEAYFQVDNLQENHKPLKLSEKQLNTLSGVKTVRTTRRTKTKSIKLK